MPNKTVCSYCGKKLDLFDRQENFCIQKKLGYGSVHDGESVELRFCCSCFDKIIDACIASPIVMED